MKMKFYVFSVAFIVLLFATAGDSPAQSVQLDWAHGIGGIGEDKNAGMIIGQDGNIYVTGEFELNVDFAPGQGGTVLSSQTGGKDSYLAKYRPSGELVWAIKGVMGGQPASTMAVDRDGNIFMAVPMSSTGADFDPGPASYHLSRASGWIAICKLDSAGSFLWARQMGGTTSRLPLLELDVAGNIYISGAFFREADFDPDPIAVFNMEAGADVSEPGDKTAPFLVKLDSAGKLIWAKTWNALQDRQSYVYMALNTYGDIYVSSRYGVGGMNYNVCDLDPGPDSVGLVPPSGTSWGYISKFDTAGNFKWGKNWVWSEFVSNDYWSRIKCDPEGNLFAMGQFQQPVDIDPGPGEHILDPGPDGRWIVSLFLCKLDSSANLAWAKQLQYNGNGVRDEKLRFTFTADRDGDMFFAGNFNRPVDVKPDGRRLDMVATKSSIQNLYLGKIKGSTGAMEWVKTLKEPAVSVNFHSAGLALEVDRDGHVYGAGGFLNNLDLDPGTGTKVLVSNGGSDMFLFRMSGISCQNTEAVLDIRACDSYIMGGRVYQQSGTYTVYMPNAAGCDSMITLNLTVNKSQSARDTLTVCDSLEAGGTKYTESGDYVVYLTASTGCDSVVYLRLTVNGSSHEDISRTVCDSILIAGEVFRETGNYRIVLQNEHGCDSVLLLDLVVGSDSLFLKQGTCDSFTLNGETYRETGRYTQTFTGAGGCDSIVQLDLTVHQADTDVDVLEGALEGRDREAAYIWIDCDHGNLPVPGAVSYRFIPPASGRYAAVVTKAGCADTTACFSVNPSGVSAVESGTAVRIYPNPVLHTAVVYAELQPGQGSARILSMSGQVIRTYNGLSGPAFRISLEDCAAGIYYLEVTEEGRQIARSKLVKY